MTRPRFVLHAARLADKILYWPVLAFVVWGELGWASDGWFAGTGDKLLHFTAYFVLGLMAAAGFKRRRPVVLTVFGLIVLGGILEILQAQIGRDSSAYDALANTAGAILGGTAGRMIVEPLRKRFPYP